MYTSVLKHLHIGTNPFEAKACGPFNLLNPYKETRMDMWTSGLGTCEGVSRWDRAVAASLEKFL